MPQGQEDDGSGTPLWVFQVPAGHEWAKPKHAAWIWATSSPYEEPTDATVFGWSKVHATAMERPSNIHLPFNSRTHCELVGSDVCLNAHRACMCLPRVPSLCKR